MRGDLTANLGFPYGRSFNPRPYMRGDISNPLKLTLTMFQSTPLHEGRLGVITHRQPNTVSIHAPT